MTTQTSTCRIYYARRPKMETAENKLEFLAQSKLNTIEFESVTPDKNNNWINLTDNDFDSLMPMANKETKAAKSQGQEQAIFKLYSLGVVTARDEWLYDFNDNALIKKLGHFVIHMKTKELVGINKTIKLAQIILLIEK